MSRMDDAKATNHGQLLETLLSVISTWARTCSCKCPACYNLTREYGTAAWHRDRINRGEAPWTEEDQQRADLSRFPCA